MAAPIGQNYLPSKLGFALVNFDFGFDFRLGHVHLPSKFGFAFEFSGKFENFDFAKETIH
jgi:hypothetical protein